MLRRLPVARHAWHACHGPVNVIIIVYYVYDTNQYHNIILAPHGVISVSRGSNSIVSPSAKLGVRFWLLTPDHSEWVGPPFLSSVRRLPNLRRLVPGIRTKVRQANSGLLV